MSAPDVQSANVVELFRAQARARPDASALVEGVGATRRAWTFADLDAASARGAARLAGAGIRPGDTVLVLVPLSIRLYEVVASVLRLGAVVQLVDPGAGRAHVRACLGRRPPDAFVGTPRAHALRLLVPEVRRARARFVVDGWVPGARSWASGQVAPREPEPVGPDAPALLTFTSGSTGRPKAAVRSHGFLRAQHAALAEALAFASGQRDLSTLPVFVLAHLASGVTSVLPAADLRRIGAFDTAPVRAQIRAERPTRCAASPAVFERLLDAPGEPTDWSSFERLDTGGAPVFADLLDRLAAAAPGASVGAVYGSTEAEPIADLPLADLTAVDRARSSAGGGLPAGRPVPQVDLRVIRAFSGGELDAAAFDALACAVDEPGEIVVAGDHVLPGYLGGEGDAEAKLRVGNRVWHRTGDAGTLDAAGRLWLLGRAAEAVDGPAGAPVHPLAVEAAVRARVGAVGCAFVGHRGRRLLACACPDAARLAPMPDALSWAGIDAIVPLGALPLDRRHAAKVDYPALRRRLDRVASGSTTSAQT